MNDEQPTDKELAALIEELNADTNAPISTGQYDYFYLVLAFILTIVCGGAAVAVAFWIW